MAFQTASTYYFNKKFKKLTKKDALLRERVIRKLQEISINPKIGEPKRYALKGLRSVHLDLIAISRCKHRGTAIKSSLSGSTQHPYSKFLKI
jgi:hypothetical protein